ncbi:Transcription factor iws1 [Entophlyctis luteolus]|nr:Transcription factor iws1 [Entophlyctis luteolus]
MESPPPPPAPEEGPDDATANVDEATAADGREADKNITLDDIFGGDSDLDENENDLAFSDSDNDVPAPVVLPKFKKKEGAPVVASEKRSKKRGRREKDDGVQEGESEPLDPEAAAKKQVANDFEEALSRLKTKRPKKLDGEDPEIDEIVAKMVERMKEAASADHESHKMQKPALAKIKMLPQVNVNLAKQHWHDQLLDNNILDAMKLWLEPLRSDGSLPNLDIQKSMFNSLQKLPINTDHLRDSKIGRVVMFYTKCDRTTPSILKLANELLEKWMRPILGRSQDYKKSGTKFVSFDATEAKKQKLLADPAQLETERFTRVPKPFLQEFKVMPTSNFGGKFDPKSDGGGSKQKKMKNILQAFKAKKR